MDKATKKAILSLIAEGRSNRNIRDTLGVTVGQVAGIRFRLAHPELNGKTKELPPAKSVLKNPEAPIKLPIRHKPRGPRNVTLFELKMHYCRFPKDEGLFCAADIVPGRSYCHNHCVAAYPAYALLHRPK